MLMCSCLFNKPISSSAKARVLKQRMMNVSMGLFDGDNSLNSLAAAHRSTAGLQT